MARNYSVIGVTADYGVAEGAGQPRGGWLFDRLTGIVWGFGYLGCSDHSEVRIGGLNTMEFRLLGPVEIWVSSSPVAIGGTKPRALLAALLLEHGRVVPVTRLIDVLWREHPPRTARDVIQTYIKSLRRVFAEQGHQDVIVTQPPGYLARVEPMDVDVHLFVDLMSRARQCGDPQTAADLLRQSLALWRGPALAGMENTLLAGEAARLEEMRLRAIEERIAAEQALGRYEQLAPELTTLVAQHPTNERLRSQLMVTLYQLGRQSDALALYREGRQALIDELGIEPGAQLTTTHEAILRNDLQWQPISSTVEAAVPSQLPWVPAEFVGRSQESAALVQGLSSRPQVITGAGGTGKTTLAVHVASQMAPFYPDGQLYAHLDGMSQVPATANEVLSRFLRALRPTDARLPEGEHRSAGAPAETAQDFVSRGRHLAHAVEVCVQLSVRIERRHMVPHERRKLVFPVPPAPVITCGRDDRPCTRAADSCDLRQTQRVPREAESEARPPRWTIRLPTEGRCAGWPHGSWCAAHRARCPARR